MTIVSNFGNFDLPILWNNSVKVSEVWVMLSEDFKCQLLVMQGPNAICQRWNTKHITPLVNNNGIL